MISVADLVKDSSSFGNYFAPDVYIQGNFEAGLIENRFGARLIALPEIFLQSIYAALEEEVGKSSGLVMFKCGRWWGKNFYRRFAEEVSGYYSKNLAQMEMVEFLQCLKQCWKTHGWGILDLDVNHYQQGFLVAKVHNSVFASAASTVDEPVCFVEAGILSAFFSQLTGRDLHCIQTSCESQGAECNHFVLGLSNRLQPVETWLKEKLDHNTIMERLCQS